jgi:hypothetical protein
VTKKVQRQSNFLRGNRRRRKGVEGKLTLREMLINADRITQERKKLCLG